MAERDKGHTGTLVKYDVHARSSHHVNADSYFFQVEERDFRMALLRAEQICQERWGDGFRIRRIAQSSGLFRATGAE